ncbi:ABC transporter ATP-binding protein [Oricola thermophila]|uniref:sn-glycerol-3-phosphate ABC transporter ATP-binding protein UgpC n=1 Tax=Oricola thermophila TaxID=2742145 RepID=A0A6N1VEF5_9HYPH|nr:sn-glycerol-3-phosphate ABC transporter ATP-binding protein UgpC [Oricola thermophila]QKV19058.1 sn-glycerol-3-phosphate ABC transporter ATP-binding protein UgpC [Oricola thermophila]
MATVELSAVRKSYGAAEVIHGIDIDIEDGEFVILVGPSGCGKSTLLRMIAGLEEINAGTIRIGERVVNNLTPKERNIAMVFQNYALYPQMTVAQNLGFSLEISGLAKADIKTKVEDTAEILGLTPLLSRKPSQLSGGQRQRVAMGRAIVRDPDVFLFDEPLSNLDANLRVQMRAEIKALHQRLGSTIVYVTHDQIEAMTMADRIVVLRAGVVEQVGTPLDLYERPANVFVASFLGSPSMNFLHGRLANGGEPTLILSDDCRLRLHSSFKARPGEKVIMGIRPQDIVEDQENGTAATVLVVEPTGADTHVTVELAGNRLTCVLPAHFNKAVGDEIMLSAATPKAHFFDADSQTRLD